MKYSLILLCVFTFACTKPVMIYEGPAASKAHPESVPIWTVENAPAKGEVTFTREDVTIVIKNEGSFPNPFKPIITVATGVFALIFDKAEASIPVD